MKILKKFLPLFLFFGIYLGFGVYYNDFYAVSPVIIAFGAIIFAVVYFKDSINKNIDYVLKGASNDKILTMCFIFFLSGVFSYITKEIGSVDYLVALILNHVTPSILFIAIFIVSCLISFALGTSVGTIVTLAPLLPGLANGNTEALALFSGCLLGGAMFGDNLSIISDTTIAATQTMGVRMLDKFKANGLIALTASLITCVLIYLNQPDFSANIHNNVTHNFWVILPYVAIIILALCNLHVLIVLTLSCLLALFIAVFQGIEFLALSKLMFEGMQSTFEIALLSLLIGGLAYLIEKNKGFEAIIELISKNQNKSVAIASILIMIVFINMAVANNTIALLICGPIAKQISERFHLEKVRIASFLDIFSCITQGLIPYGAQVLILLTLINQKISFTQLVSKSYYLIVLLLISIFYLVFFMNKNDKQLAKTV
ncbi:Na+/H+ antiporter NhaC family protein [Flavobacterium sp. xlx-214]|uniref:Na+/H+ antiporter NhaC family protein n=1 Tax=unclassified Flavobacterium TaxID=196869 RepID=UPI0013D0C1A1|nr:MULTISPECIES: Na+/H+ antiporter NhaC family protein [unclassified Flavobacterium]MBA5791465.1 Na+/H+ antiporter NhaC family protein [Flavobacterium sp. xlx-221]QMI83385.1 Na+/H+ antiporter NhaC family protein [Flavobacterium sp. xlx-214]